MLSLLAAAASLAEFEATLAAQDSATAALRQWCELRHIAAPANIRATRVGGSQAIAPADLRRRLKVRRHETLAFRHVRLTCGQTVMSEAYNWYVPSRLTPAMNAALDTSDTPFGTVAAPLRFRRQRLGSERARCLQGTILAHRARLMLPGGRPLAMLVECYTPANLTAGN